MMTDIEGMLKQAIEYQFGGTAMHVQATPIVDTFNGATIWEGVVHEFVLTDHPSAKRAYAWSSPIEGSGKRRLFTELHFPPIDSPLAAVRAVITAEHQIG